MRPANPTSCEPLAVIAPLMGAEPSVKSGSCVLPLASAVAVVVAETALTVELKDDALPTCSTAPELENCRFDPNAALSCATTDPMPPEKFTPITWSFGLAAWVFCTGRAPGRLLGASGVGAPRLAGVRLCT